MYSKKKIESNLNIVNSVEFLNKNENILENHHAVLKEIQNYFIQI